MRISELAQRSEVSIATIKFYLREGLLPDGVRTAATQARYDDSHLARLRLIRALLGPGGLSIAAAKRVIAAIEQPPDSMHDLLGAATVVLSPPVSVSDESHHRVHALLERWGWVVDEKDCPSHLELAEALDALEAASFELSEADLDLYREHIAAIAAYEVAGVPIDSPAAAVRYVVLGTVLIEPLLLALRKLAQQEASARRFTGSADLGA